MGISIWEIVYSVFIIIIVYEIGYFGGRRSNQKEWEKHIKQDIDTMHREWDMYE